MPTNSKIVRGTIAGGDHRSISVRYGAGPCDLAIVRLCDCHGLPSLEEGTRVELRYVKHGTYGAWYHAFPGAADDAPPENADTAATRLREQAATAQGPACLCDGSGFYIEDNGMRGARQRSCPVGHAPALQIPARSPT